MAKMRLEDVTFAYGALPVVRQISLALNSGVFYGIVGPNGAGKSTILKLLDRFVIPQQGTIFLDERDLNSYSLQELARRIALIPQNSPDFSFTVEEVVLLARTPHSFRWQPPSAEDREIAAASMALTEVQHLAGRHVGELSGGERQRVNLARVFAQGTDILLLDEPTTFLDLEHQIRISKLLWAKAREGKTCVGVFHDLNLVSNYCDYVFVLAAGELMAEGEPEKVFTPQLIKKIYNVGVVAVKHPHTGRPIIVP